MVKQQNKLLFYVAVATAGSYTQAKPSYGQFGVESAASKVGGGVAFTMGWHSVQCRGENCYAAFGSWTECGVEVRVAKSVDKGNSWLPQQTVSGPFGIDDDFGVNIAVGPRASDPMEDEIHLIWSQDVNDPTIPENQKGLWYTNGYFQQAGSNSFFRMNSTITKAVFSDSYIDLWHARLTVDGQNNIYIGYCVGDLNNESEYKIFRSIDGGNTFDTETLYVKGIMQWVDFQADHEGNLFLLYSWYSGYPLITRRMRFMSFIELDDLVGRVWTDPEDISGDLGTAAPTPSLAVLDKDHIYAVYGGQNGVVLCFTVVTPHVWNEKQIVSWGVEYGSIAAREGTGGKVELSIVWEEGRNFAFAQSLNGGITFTVESGNARNAFYPSVAYDGNGDAVILYSDYHGNEVYSTKYLS